MDKPKPKPDDRRDNVERIQENINNTIENIEAAEDMLAKTDNPETRQQIQEKNERRKEALKGMREEIRDEAVARERGYS
ncbi:MAG: small acid-soluble spore protein Tlp [Clostridiaceae bacterium]|nr:small acid-soluble spore protein Tlp [Clostridiaceae bacterium]